MPTIERLQALSTSVEVSSRTAYHPDAAVAELTDMHFHAVIELGGVGFVSAGGSVVRGLSEGHYAHMISVAMAAVDAGGGELGVDTAVGRPITTLAITVREHHVDRSPRHASFRLNHLDVGADGPTAWRTLVEELAATLGDSIAAADHEHLGFLARWFRIRPPHPDFDAGRPVRCPAEAEVAVPLDEGVFIRVGQRGDSRGLWLVHRAAFRTVHVVEMASRQRVGTLSFHEGSRWAPGGAYAGRLGVMFEPGGRPNRIEVDGRDPEGVYVQPATFDEVRGVVG